MKSVKLFSKEKIPLIFTIVSYASIVMFGVIFAIWLKLVAFLENVVGSETLGTISTVIMIICVLLDIIVLLLSPIVHVVFGVLAARKRNWKWMRIHIVAAVILGGVVVLFGMIVSATRYA
jgi:hypothetical protein